MTSTFKEKYQEVKSGSYTEISVEIFVQRRRLSLDISSRKVPFSKNLGSHQEVQSKILYLGTIVSQLLVKRKLLGGPPPKKMRAPSVPMQSKCYTMRHIKKSTQCQGTKT